MQQDDQVYVKLQKHLDQQAVGFPATRSGAEIKILKHIFTPGEAEIACCLNYRFEPLETIFDRAGHLVNTPEELQERLEDIQKKGGIEAKSKNGRMHYCTAPLVVGIYEFQLNRLTPKFIADFNQYTSDRKFGIEFLSTKLPQMRTIPVSKSIHPHHNVATFDEVTRLLQDAEAPFAIFECICRKKKSLQGESCEKTGRKDTCMAIGPMGRMALKAGTGREISREEAISILEENQKEGLVLQPSNTEKAEFICSCCGCCCGMLGVYRSLPRPLEFWASNFHAAVDADTCIGCGACARSCQVSAVSVPRKKEPAVVDIERCLGCGVCVPGCPTESISLVKKPDEIKPPLNREELYEIIMANKKGRLAKMKLKGKLIVDAIRTGHTDLLKS
ncbi:MAG: 4Fe-4S dicluster domain-containing protein [Deltaproteobacteria bacterium]|jgi:Pyruvate/2-oxoacid:ferredoxin oxidoreductase delta subunit|nr:4Fe-4S dicluster domain-containing protein [Deltaproteobacteria bacterium]